MNQFFDNSRGMIVPPQQMMQPTQPMINPQSPILNMFGGFSNFMQIYNQFANSGMNPQVMVPQMIQQMFNSGRITQDQLNQAVQFANQLTGRRF